MLKSVYKEDLSISYILAICATAGIDYEIIRHDADSVDGLLKKSVNLSNGTNVESLIAIQLKTTSSESQYSDDGNEISYALKAKNYNDLCSKATYPRILGLLVLPDNENEWITWSTEELLLKGCMYWSEFSKDTPTNNSSTKTVKIPKKNVINADALLNLLTLAGEEVWP